MTALRVPGDARVPCHLFLDLLRPAGRAAASAQKMAPKKWVRLLSRRRVVIGEQTVVGPFLLLNAPALDPGARRHQHLTHPILRTLNKPGAWEVNSNLLSRSLLRRHSKNVAISLAAVEPTQLHPPRILMKWTIGVRNVPCPKLVRLVEVVSMFCKALLF